MAMLCTNLHTHRKKGVLKILQIVIAYVIYIYRRLAIICIDQLVRIIRLNLHSHERLQNHIFNTL